MKRNAPALPAKDHEGICAKLRVCIVNSTEIINNFSAFMLVGLGGSAASVGILFGLVLLGIVDMPEWGLVGLALSPCSACPFKPAMPDRAYFERHGLGVSEVARRLGVCVSNVNRWFTSGHVPVGRREDLLRLAVELACRNETGQPAKEVRNEFSDL